MDQSISKPNKLNSRKFGLIACPVTFCKSFLTSKFKMTGFKFFSALTPRGQISSWISSCWKGLVHAKQSTSVWSCKQFWNIFKATVLRRGWSEHSASIKELLGPNPQIKLLQLYICIHKLKMVCWWFISYNVEMDAVWTKWVTFGR